MTTTAPNGTLLKIGFYKMNYPKLLRLPLDLLQETGKFLRRCWNHLTHGACITIKEDTYVWFESSGTLLYEGSYDKMPANLKPRFDAMQAEMRENLDYFKRRQAYWRAKEAKQAKGRGKDAV